MSSQAQKMRTRNSTFPVTCNLGHTVNPTYIDFALFSRLREINLLLPKGYS